ncbi:MAG: MBL fold metallo-hydrolase [Methanobacterium sp.]|jgi:glyoxylase-like metal-dependent hydrolase (beta-lactamase superfamily II)
MKHKNYPLKKNTFKSWDKVFENPRPIKLEEFQTGSVIINKKGAINPEHPLAQDIKDEKLEVPILAYWIHHEGQGDYLLDAGLDKSYYQDPHGGIKNPLADEFIQKKDQNIKFHLEKKRIQLKCVFLSHLHPDHIAGIRELPKKIPYIIGKGEFNEYKPDDFGNFLKNLKILYEIDFSKIDEIPPLGPSVDLLGDGSLWSIFTPGHTPGHISFLVNGFNGPIFLTMDACFIHENIEKKIAPSSYTWNIKLAQKTLEKIIRFLKEYPQVKVHCGHE